MTVSIPRVTSITVLERYKLRLTFDDGITGDVDLSDLPNAGPVFEPLRDPGYFASAYIDPIARTVAWPGDIDLDPEALHDEARKCRVSNERPKRRGILAPSGARRSAPRA